MTLYFNGVFVSAGRVTGGASGSLGEFPLGLSLLGVTDHGDWYHFFMHAVIDEVRIWSTNRSQAEIQANMYVPLPLPSPHLEAYWRFDEGTGTIAHDSSGHGRHAELVNGPAWVTSDIGFSPFLSISLVNASTAVIAWPSPSVGFVLRQSANFLNWADVALPVYDDGTNKSVVVPLGQNRMFYRLRKS